MLLGLLDHAHQPAQIQSKVLPLVFNIIQHLCCCGKSFCIGLEIPEVKRSVPVLGGWRAPCNPSEHNMQVSTWFPWGLQLRGPRLSDSTFSGISMSTCVQR